MSGKLDVHTYDGQLPRMDIKEFKTFDKKENFAKLHTMIVEHKHLDDSIKRFATQAVQIIMDDIDNSKNYSGSDLQRADDVLSHICIKIFSDTDQDSIVQNLAEQLSDIVTSGSCPQGRVTRLFQLYMAFKCGI
jgi:hypothetical protein